METFSFCPNGQVPETLTRDASNTMTMAGWTFSARPTSGMQRRFRVRLHGLRWFIDDTTNLYDSTTEPELNARALELFYEDHEQWNPFNWNHPHLGVIPVRFGAPLNVPAAMANGDGLLDPLEITLVEAHDVYQTAIVPYASYSLAMNFQTNEYWSDGSGYSSVASLPNYSFTRTGTLLVPDTDGGVDSFAANVPAINGYGYHAHRTITNLLLNAGSDAVLATQTTAPLTAVPHTLAFIGTGTITLSGASTAGPLVGTGANDQVVLNFTPTAAALTLTVTGSVKYAVLISQTIRKTVPIVTTAGATANTGNNDLILGLKSSGASIASSTDWMAEVLVDLSTLAATNTGRLLRIYDSGTASGYATLDRNSAGALRLLGDGNSVLYTVASGITEGVAAIVIRRSGSHYKVGVRNGGVSTLSAVSTTNDVAANGFNRVAFSLTGTYAQTPIQFAGLREGTFTDADMTARLLELIP